MFAQQGDSWLVTEGNKYDPFDLVKQCQMMGLQKKIKEWTHVTLVFTVC